MIIRKYIKLLSNNYRLKNNFTINKYSTKITANSFRQVLYYLLSLLVINLFLLLLFIIVIIIIYYCYYNSDI